MINSLIYFPFLPCMKEHVILSTFLHYLHYHVFFRFEVMPFQRLYKCLKDDNLVGSFFLFILEGGGVG